MVRVSQNLVADLGVGDRAVFLSQVKPQLALMTEVQVTFLTLEEKIRAESEISTSFCSMDVCSCIFNNILYTYI